MWLGPFNYIQFNYSHIYCSSSIVFFVMSESDRSSDQDKMEVEMEDLYPQNEGSELEEEVNLHQSERSPGMGKNFISGDVTSINTIAFSSKSSYIF